MPGMQRLPQTLLLTLKRKSNAGQTEKKSTTKENRDSAVRRSSGFGDSVTPDRLCLLYLYATSPSRSSHQVGIPIISACRDFLDAFIAPELVVKPMSDPYFLPQLESSKVTVQGDESDFFSVR